jgi:hypothetical protein
VSDPDYWWEPPLAGSEAEHLFGALDRMRVTFRWKADDLDAGGLNARLGVGTLTLAGLLRHLAFVEEHASTVRLTGEAPAGPWPLGDGGEDWEFNVFPDASPTELYSLWDEAVERSRRRMAALVAEAGMDQLIALRRPDGRQASLRRLVCDLIEEYGRHTGHADLIRESIDGRVGEDPPARWHPVGPRSARRS